MKKARFVCVLLLVLTLAAMAVNLFVVRLPDWAVRTAGVGMLLALAGTAYTAVKGSSGQ